MYWECEQVQEFWRRLNEYTETKCARTLSKVEIFLGLPDKGLWTIPLAAKRYIYQKRYKEEQLSIEEFLRKVMEIIRTEEYIAKKNI